MNTLTIDGWCKASDQEKSSPIGSFRFHIDDKNHLRLEETEEQLKESGAKEAFVDVDSAEIELETPDTCGELSDCKLRVYLSEPDQRGQFHLVGNRASDGSLIYTNSVMIDQLG